MTWEGIGWNPRRVESFLGELLRLQRLAETAGSLKSRCPPADLHSVNTVSVSSGRHMAPIRGGGPLRLEAILVVSSDHLRRAELADVVDAGGWHATTVASAQEALWELSPVLPHLVLIDVPDASEADWALDLVDRVRRRDGGDGVTVVILTPYDDLRLTVAAFGRRADDVVAGTPHEAALLARLRIRLERRPVPREDLVVDPITGALSDASFAAQVEHELDRLRRGGRPGVLALLQIDELPELEARHGLRVREELMAQVVTVIREDSRDLDFVGHTRGVLAILMPATPAKGGQIRLDRLARLLSARSMMAAGTVVQLTPIIGYAVSEPGLTVDAFEERAWVAMMRQAEELDLCPTRWTPALSGSGSGASKGSRLRRVLQRVRTPAQVLAQQLVCLLVPLGVYEALDGVGIDISRVVYFFLVISLACTAAAIWLEGFAALRRTQLPDEPETLPPASAVIAAYLPNEADTVVETVEAFLRQDYPDLQVILAYNTPEPLPVEAELQEIARRDPRFEPLRIEGSVSKAQNVNAALTKVRGEVVGVFDADHHPDPGAFRRASRWLANGADVVQGHCVVRNGDTSFVTRLVATEFEAIYAVSHPGRARLHGFGIFGGTNGYWRAEVLKRKRMRGFMLTEDIDSSMRVVERGGTIVSDPGLISEELAPVTAKALWNQRMRWAQGLVTGVVAAPAADVEAPGCAAAQPSRRLLSPRLARDLPVGLAADVPAAGVLAASRRSDDQLVRAVLRGHDAVHDDGGTGPGAVRLEAGAPVDQAAQAVVRALPLRVAPLLHRAQEHHRADGAPEGADGRADVEGDSSRAPRGRRTRTESSAGTRIRSVRCCAATRSRSTPRRRLWTRKHRLW